MKLQQLSVFLENQPGHLRHACQVLAEANLSIVTLSLADTQQFGILRLLVQEWERAKRVLEDHGFTTQITEMLAIEVVDQPGGLAGILSEIEAARLNVAYMYAFTYGQAGNAVLLFRFDDPDAAIARLQPRGVNLLSGIDLFSRSKQ